jgi:cutinase-like protein
MAKVQFIATAVALRGWRKLTGTGSASIGDSRPSARRAFSIAVCQHRFVKSRRAAVSIGAAAVATWALQGASMPIAAAAPCPDAEVVFARGTTEAPGPGPTGDAFIDALRSRVAGKSVGVYPVDYPATTDFPTAVDGISDARAHILATAANCPKTKLVLGGFSQGAAVMGFVTAGVVPDGVTPQDVPAPMPPDIANHVAAVALFGKPSTRFMHAINDPPVAVGPQYAAKTVDLCVDNDLVCDLTGKSFSAHNTYVEAGMVDQGATFAANQLQALWAADAAAPPAEGATPSPQTTQAPSPLSAPAGPVASPPAAALGPTPHLPSAPVTPPGPPATPVAPPPAVAPLT